MRMSFIVLCVLLSGVWSASCSSSSDDDEQPEAADAWWAPLMSYVPADPGYEVHLANRREFHRKLGLDAVASGDCATFHENLASDDADAAVSAIFNTSDRLFTRSVTDVEEVAGFSYCDIVRDAVFEWGEPVDIIEQDGSSISRALVGAAYELADGTSEVVAKLVESGYVAADYRGSDIHSKGQDFELLDIYLSALNRVAIVNDIVLRGPTTDLVHAAIDANADGGSALSNPHTSDLLVALGETDAIWAIGSQFLANDRWIAVGDPDRAAFGYTRTASGEDVLKAAFLYSDEAAADEHARAFLDYLNNAKVDSLTGKAPSELCDEATVEPMQTESGSIIVGTCIGGQAARWNGLIFAGFAFWSF